MTTHLEDKDKRGMKDRYLCVLKKDDYGLKTSEIGKEPMEMGLRKESSLL